MVVRFSLIFLFTFSLLACKEEVEHKGSEIPPETVLNTPVQWERQILYLNSLIQEDDQAILLFYRARAYFNTHQYHLAKLDMDKLMNRSNEISDEYNLLNAWIQLKLGNLEKAQQLIQMSKYGKNQFSNTSTFFLELYIQKKQLNLAQQLLTQIKKDSIHKIANPILELLVVGDTLSLKRYVANNTQMAFKDEFSERTYLNFAIDLVPSLHFQSNCLKELKKYPNDPYYLHAWGMFLKKINKLDLSEKVLSKTLSLHPDNMQFKYDFGQLMLQKRDYGKAFEYFSKIPKSSNLFWLAQNEKIICLLNSQQKTQAKALFDTLMKISPQKNQVYTRYYRWFVTPKDSLNQIRQDTLLNLNQ